MNQHTSTHKLESSAYGSAWVLQFFLGFMLEVCVHMAAYVCIWLHMCAYGYICVHMAAYVCIWLHMCAYGYICVHMAAYVCICVHMGTYACIWAHLCAYGHICVHMGTQARKWKQHRQPQGEHPLKKIWQIISTV